jgi:hypothetical protein
MFPAAGGLMTISIHGGNLLKKISRGVDHMHAS